MSPNDPIIVVCIDAHDNTKLLIRAASRRAKQLGVDWVALYVASPVHFNQVEHHENVLQNGTMATNLGGQFVEVTDESILTGITHFVDQSAERGHPVTELIVGTRTQEGLLSELQPRLDDELEKKFKKTATRVKKIRLSEQEYKSSWLSYFQLRTLDYKKLLLSQFWLAVVSAVCLLVGSLFDVSGALVLTHIANVSLLIVVLITGLKYGLLPSLLTVLSAFTLLNLAFIPPPFSLDITNINQQWLLVFHALLATLLAIVGSYVHIRLEMLSVRVGRNEALYQISRLSGMVESRTEAVGLIHKELTSLLGGDIALFLPSSMQQEALTLVYPADTALNETENKALLTCWEELKTTGFGSMTAPSIEWRFEPMLTNESEVGVLGIRITEDVHVDASFGRLLSAVSDQCAALLERIDFTRIMSESRIREEREKLRSMLLSSVSHDLKTPLASIIGSLSVYQRMHKSGRLNGETAQELAVTALEEAQRLDSFITNILDMTRIESGEIQFNQLWVSVDVPVNNVLARLRQRLQFHTVKVVKDVENLKIFADPMMTEQVLQNVIDNAVKYSPKQTEITIHLHQDDRGFYYDVIDQGEGIPDDKLEAIFDKYERLRHKDSHIAGTGLGLAIARAVMENQDGWIDVSRDESGGAKFRLSFNQVKQNDEL